MNKINLVKKFDIISEQSYSDLFSYTQAEDRIALEGSKENTVRITVNTAIPWAHEILQQIFFKYFLFFLQTLFPVFSVASNTVFSLNFNELITQGHIFRALDIYFHPEVHCFCLQSQVSQFLKPGWPEKWWAPRPIPQVPKIQIPRSQTGSSPWFLAINGLSRIFPGGSALGSDTQEMFTQQFFHKWLGRIDSPWYPAESVIF